MNNDSIEPGGLQSTTERLGSDRLGRLLLRLSLPSIASMIVMSMYHLVDTIWLGRLSYQAIAARLSAQMKAISSELESRKPKPAPRRKPGRPRKKAEPAPEPAA